MRTEADGLFYHPDGATAAAVLKRMAESTTNYNLDDPFEPAIDESERELAKLEERIFRAEQRLITLRHEKVRAQQRLEEQRAAKKRFVETGEIDEVLVPSVLALAEAEAAEQRKKIRDAEKFVLPQDLKKAGWEADKTIRVTDTEIIVTIRKRRADTPVDVELAKERIAKTVEDSMQPYRVEDSRYRRVLREHIARRPQQPKGPPDD